MPPQLGHHTYLCMCAPDHSILRGMAIFPEVTLWTTHNVPILIALR